MLRNVGNRHALKFTSLVHLIIQFDLLNQIPVLHIVLASLCFVVDKATLRGDIWSIGSICSTLRAQQIAIVIALALLDLFLLFTVSTIPRRVCSKRAPPSLIRPASFGQQCAQLFFVLRWGPVRSME